MDRRLSGAPSGRAQRDLLNWSNSWMKSIALERHFLITFCCCRQKVSRKLTGPEINRTSMIINCKATPLVGKADAFALPSTQSSPIIL
jgi:hypothetical protein